MSSKIELQLNKIARLKKNLTQDELCKLANIGRTTLSKLENGEGNPSRNLMLKLSEILNTTPEYLFFSDNDE